MTRSRRLVITASAVLVALCCLLPLRAEDNYVHTFTGFTFPPQVGDFTRVKITPFNEAHSDIEVDYNNNPFTVHLSVYVYPASGIYSTSVPLKVHYDDCKAAVLHASSSAKLLSEKAITLDKRGVKYDGYSGLFTMQAKFVDDKEQTLLSQLLIFQRGDYYVLYRISYAESDKDHAEKQIDAFIQKLAWPPGDGKATQ